ncbi:MAG: cation:proton antiporter [Candidatus ainarchaeum sp.]|nr:cation:proton antiporter [Candidatus ainarchaeum sp.]
MNPEFVFLIVAGIIFIGYLGLIFFKKTKIPDLLILLSVGLLLGPILGFVDSESLILFQGILPYFASLALMMLLFDGGLNLKFFDTLKGLGNSLIFTITNLFFVLTSIFILFFVFNFFGVYTIDPLVGLFIACVLGGTSSAIILTLVVNTSANEKTKTLLSLESALTDAFCVILAVAIGQIYISGSADIIIVISNILTNFCIAGVVGFFIGIIFLKLITPLLKGRNYIYLMTLAIMFVTYSLISIFRGNGAIGVLVFGIVLGNSKEITTMLKMHIIIISEEIKDFQGQLSFLIKTLFFVYLGLLFQVKFLNDINIIIISLIIVILIVGGRKITAKLMGKLVPEIKTDENYLTYLCARGLAAAVLISLPASMGLLTIENTPFTQVFIENLTAIVFLVIVGTNIVTTIGVILAEKGKNTITPVEKKITKIDIPDAKTENK